MRLKYEQRMHDFYAISTLTKDKIFRWRGETLLAKIIKIATSEKQK